MKRYTGASTWHRILLAVPAFADVITSVYVFGDTAERPHGHSNESIELSGSCSASIWRRGLGYHFKHSRRFTRFASR